MWRRIKRFFGIVGPGVVTGAADDDPSAIVSFSQSGAQFGFMQLWSVWYILPMMIAVQEVCARIGVVTGRGIALVVRQYYPRPVLYLVVLLITVANIINLGADLTAMAAATHLIVPIPYSFLVVVFAIASCTLQTFVSYSVYSRFLKWLTVCLVAYVFMELS
jgi:NRAMP (natural resistance-associated macrophage protein)-like metal ion transporter